ncbi:mvp [Symbiodinium necroappetens]|uniref:Mvp protein n=1 Tax=Symbiodinium necroappetens TaxID=1628268 RepID=A0A812QXE3_9DINO|nr:mvp [Symbiodinium necroappetens]
MLCVLLCLLVVFLGLCITIHTRAVPDGCIGVRRFIRLQPAPKTKVTRVLLSIFTLLYTATGAIYAAEHDVNPQFPDFFTALYFGLTTLTTVGFGDITPITAQGRLVVAASILAGVGIIPYQLSKLAEVFMATASFDRQGIRFQSIQELRFLRISGEFGAPVPFVQRDPASEGCSLLLALWSQADSALVSPTEKLNALTAATLELKSLTRRLAAVLQFLRGQLARALRRESEAKRSANFTDQQLLGGEADKLVLYGRSNDASIWQPEAFWGRLGFLAELGGIESRSLRPGEGLLALDTSELNDLVIVRRLATPRPTIQIRDSTMQFKGQWYYPRNFPAVQSACTDKDNSVLVLLSSSSDADHGTGPGIVRLRLPK